MILLEYTNSENGAIEPFWLSCVLIINYISILNTSEKKILLLYESAAGYSMSNPPYGPE